MKTNNSVRIIGAVAGAVLLAASQASAIIAFDTPNTTVANQGGFTYGLDLGMQFTVDNPGGITINQLGAFDAGQDGWGSATISVAIYSGSSIVGSSAAFNSTTPGTISGTSAYAFQTVPSFYLGVGTYMIVASGLGTTDNPNYNSNGGVSSDITSYSGPDVSFPTGPTSGNYYNVRTVLSPALDFPTTHDEVGGTGPVGRYGAGSFDFTPVPEVGTFGAAAVGLLGLVYAARHVRIRRKEQGA